MFSVLDELIRREMERGRLTGLAVSLGTFGEVAMPAELERV